MGRESFYWFIFMDASDLFIVSISLKSLGCTFDGRSIPVDDERRCDIIF